MSSDVQKELAESVAYFEQILNVIPDDRTALEFLCVACAQLGDSAKHLKYALALAEVTLREKDASSAGELANSLSAFDASEAHEAAARLRALVSPGDSAPAAPPAPSADPLSAASAAKAECDLLRWLVSEGHLDDSAAQVALAALANPAAGGDDFLVSALSVLEKENVVGAERACAAVADAAHAPPIPLTAFEIPPAGVRMLPERLVRMRGVVPFAKLGKEWAVAMLNPLDVDLKRAVALAMGARCHFFLAVPSSVAPTLERVFRNPDESKSAVPPVAVPFPR